VFRRAAADEPIYNPAASNSNQWVAIITDDPDFEAACPVLHFQDTIWLQLLANLAWDRSQVLES